jgi:translation initiation factor 3 subunit M
MAKVVELSSEEEQLQHLFGFYRSQKQLPETDPSVVEALQHISQKKSAPVLEKLAVDSESMVTTSGEKDIEGYFTLLWTLLRKYDPESATRKKLVASITANTSDKPLLRLKILNIFYNMTDSRELQFTLFSVIVKYAADSRNVEVLLPQFKQIDKLIKGWGITLHQQQELFKIIRTVLKDSNRHKKAYKFLIRYLRSVETGGMKEGPELLQFAAAAVVEAIKLPNVFEFEDLSRFTSVQALKNGSESNVKLFNLLQLFVFDKLDAFLAFHQKNPDFLQSVGLVYEESVKKIRLLSLATVASQTRLLPYAQVAAALQIPEAEVESWVISSIAAGVLDAKLDQVRRLVLVHRTTQRVFPDTQWEQLSNNMASWKDNIKSLLQIIQASKKISTK